MHISFNDILHTGPSGRTSRFFVLPTKLESSKRPRVLVFPEDCALQNGAAQLYKDLPPGA